MCVYLGYYDKFSDTVVAINSTFKDITLFNNLLHRITQGLVILQQDDDLYSKDVYLNAHMSMRVTCALPAHYLRITCTLPVRYLPVRYLPERYLPMHYLPLCYVCATCVLLLKKKR